MYSKWVLLGLLLIACNTRQEILPKSTGSTSEIIVVASDAIWENFPSKAIKDNFEKDYPGLQQSEPLFNIIRIKPSDFSRVFKTHQNIILISENGEDTKTYDLWSAPQLVVSLKWKLESNQTQFVENCREYVNVFYHNQIQKISQKYNNVTSVKNKFGVKLKMPEEYTIINDNANIFWATYSPPKKDLIKQVLCFSLKVNERDFHERLVIKVDSILRKQLKGGEEHNFVQIEKKFPIERDNNIYRGLWKMENEFMGGPFLMKIQKRNNNLVIVSIGIVFAPGEAKKRYMVEMDALL